VGKAGFSLSRVGAVQWENMARHKHLYWW